MLPQPIKAFLYFAVLSLYCASAIAQTYADVGTGPGGVLSAPYMYGSGGKPFLRVRVDGATCYLENEKIITVSLLNEPEEVVETKSDTVQFACANGNTLRNSAMSTPASPSNDFHYYATRVVEMYESEFGIGPEFGINYPIMFKVHNAHIDVGWWGKWYGDFGSLNDRDVVPEHWLIGHEVSHAFTHYTSRLSEGGAQTAALNEAFSAIMGEVFELWVFNKDNPGVRVNPGPFDSYWLISTWPDQFDEVNTIENRPPGEVHEYAYIFLHGFYRLASTQGWDILKAARVVVKANTEKWRSNEGFASSVCKMEEAASELGYSVSDVTIAFEGVVDEENEPTCAERAVRNSLSEVSPSTITPVLNLVLDDDLN